MMKMAKEYELQRNQVKLFPNLKETNSNISIEHVINKAHPLDTNSEDVLEKTYKGEDFYKVKKEFEEFLRAKRQKEINLVFDE